MERRLKNCFENTTENILDISELKLSLGDLKMVLDELEQNLDVHFINWGQNTSILGQNKPINNEIQLKLVENLIANKDVVDLSKFEINEDFLKCFIQCLEENRSIGAVILGERNESVFKKEHLEKIEEYVSRNNEEFQRYPSDYVHCLLASHCRQKSENLWNKLSNLGWEIDNEFSVQINYYNNEDNSSPRKYETLGQLAAKKAIQNNNSQSNKYVSILYRNDSTRQLVLAFRGIKFEVKDFFVENSKLEQFVYGMMSKEITTQSYYAYLHSREAFDISREKKYNLSFTGYSFGAWLAEQSVFFCYKDFNSMNTRAVTFDSPGSWEIIQHLAETNIYNDMTNKEDLGKFLDVRTYLLSPNFINTSSQHIGRVFRLFERSKLTDKIDSFDSFIKSSIISRIASFKMRKTIEDWYFNRARPQFSKYFFYLNGLRSLFTNDIMFILNEFDENTGRLRDHPKEVLRWPLTDFRPTQEGFKDVGKIIVSLTPFASHIPQALKHFVTKPIDFMLNFIMHGVTKHCFSSLALTYNILIGIVSGKLNDDQCLKSFEHDQTVLKRQEIEATILNEMSFRLVYQGSYELKDIMAPYRENLRLCDPSHVDFKLRDVALGFDRRYENSYTARRMDHLKSLFRIDSKWNGLVFEVSIESSDMTIDEIRERFLRLVEIDEICQQICGPKSPSPVANSRQEIVSYFGGMEMPNFVKFEEDIFENIDEKFSDLQFVYLYGDSGYGKTTLARQYGYYKKDAYSIQFIDSVSLESNLSELQNRLFIPTTTKQENIIKLIKTKINSFEKNFLFIFDNVKQEEDIKSIMENLNDRHKFLITTRDKNKFSKSDSTNEHGVEIKQFDEKTCIDYLKNNDISLDSDEEKDQWMKLLRRGNEDTLISPKSLELVVQNYKNHHFLDCEDFAQKLESLLESSSKYYLIKKENELGFEILKFLAYLNGSSIHSDIVKKLFMDKPKESLNESIDYLKNNSFIKFDKLNLNEIIYEVHEITQNEIKDILKKNEKEWNDIISRITYVLDDLLNQYDSGILRDGKIKRFNAIIKQGEHLLKSDWKNKLTDANFFSFLKKSENICRCNFFNLDYALRACSELIEISAYKDPNDELSKAAYLQNISSIHNIREEYDDALEMSKLAYEIRKRLLEKNHPDVAKSAQKLGDIYLNKGMYTESYEYSKEALEIRQNSFPENSPEIAESLNIIGLIYELQDDHETGFNFLNKAFEIRKKTLLPDNKCIGDSLINLGLNHVNQGKYKEAVGYYKDAVEIYKKSLPLNHPNLIMTLNNIGTVYELLSKPKEALKYKNEALEKFELMPMVKEENRSSLMIMMGLCFETMGNYSDALKMYENALEKLEKSATPNPKDLADLYCTIGLIYEKLGDDEKACDRRQKAVNIGKKNFSSNHSFLARLLNDLGITFEKKGKYQEALDCQMEAYEISSKTTDYHHTVTYLDNIGMIYFKVGYFAEALETFNECQELIENFLPSNKPDLARSYYLIAMSLEKLGDFVDAITSYQKAFDLSKECEDQSMLKYIDDLARVYLENDALELALQLYAEEFLLTETYSSFNYPEMERILKTMDLIGLAFERQKSFDEAFDCFKTILGLRKNNGSILLKDPENATCLDNLGRVCFLRRSYEEAIFYYEEELKVLKRLFPTNHSHILKLVDNIELVKNKRDNIVMTRF